MKSMFIKGLVLSYLFLLMSSCNISEEKSTPEVIDIEQIKTRDSGQRKRVC